MSEEKKKQNMHQKSNTVEKNNYRDGAGLCHDLQATTESINTKMQNSILQQAPCDEFVYLNVGGVPYLTTLATITTEPESHLAQLFTNPALHPPKDSSGSFFIDRDGNLFRHILNYLRGYSVCIDPSLLHELLWELEYYGIRGFQKLLGVDDTTKQRFLTGPGVSSDGKLLRSMFLVSVLSEEWLSSGSHSQSYRIEKRDFIGIGVISQKCKDRGTDFGKEKNCAAYYMNGLISSNFKNPQSWETGRSYDETDKVSVAIDFALRKIIWYKNDVEAGSVEFEKSLKKVELQFAVVLKWPAVVNIESGLFDENVS